MTPLPRSDEAERAVLAAPLLSPAAWPAVAAINPHDLYSKRHQLILSALHQVHDAGRALDLVTLADALEQSGQLGQAGGPAYLAELLDGQARSVNVAHYVEIVREKANRRALVVQAQGIISAAGNGSTPGQLAELVEGLAGSNLEQSLQWRPATLEGVLEEAAGQTHYLVDRLLPLGEVSIIGAGWKVGKTLIAYRLILDAISGRPALGHFNVPEPVPVVLFQLEMPPTEEERRFRRIAIGASMHPAEVPGFVKTGALTVYNRPALNLTRPQGVAAFHDRVRSCGARLVVVDSLIAAFAGADLNDNSAVRELFARSFLPLTSEGIAVLLLHHKRKSQGGGRHRGDDRSALLGAQAWGAAAGRIYSLERIADEARDPARSFRARLSLTGSWTPEDAADAVVEVRDTDDGGTVVRVLDAAEQVRRGGVTAAQRAGLAFARIVKARRRTPRKEAVTEVATDLEVTRKTVQNGLKWAKEQGWIQTVPSEGAQRNERDLVPGPNLDEGAS